MDTRFSEDVIPLSDLKVNPGKVVNRLRVTKRPVLLIRRGRGVAVVQGLDEHEKAQEALAFIKAVALGLMEARQGEALSMDDIKEKLELD